MNVFSVSQPVLTVLSKSKNVGNMKFPVHRIYCVGRWVNVTFATKILFLYGSKIWSIRTAIVYCYLSSSSFHRYYRHRQKYNYSYQLGTEWNWICHEWIINNTSNNSVITQNTRSRWDTIQIGNLLSSFKNHPMRSSIRTPLLPPLFLLLSDKKRTVQWSFRWVTSTFITPTVSFCVGNI